MKASELIKQLTELENKHGDLEVDIFQDEADEVGELKGISVFHDEREKPIGFTLCGPETIQAFIEGE